MAELEVRRNPLFCTSHGVASRARRRSGGGGTVAPGRVVLRSAAHRPPGTPLSPQGADRSFVFASGMAALTAVTRLVHTGQRVLSGDDIYGGTSRLLSRVLPKQGISVTNCDMTDLAARHLPRPNPRSGRPRAPPRPAQREQGARTPGHPPLTAAAGAPPPPPGRLQAVKKAMTPDVKLVILESPTNPRLQARSLARRAAQRGPGNARRRLACARRSQVATLIWPIRPSARPPGRPQITDIKAVTELAHTNGALVCVDNSIMAMFQQPLARPWPRLLTPAAAAAAP